MGEARRRKESDATWGKDRRVFPDKTYPCIAIISYLFDETDAITAVDTYIHEDDNKEAAWEVLKKENPKGYEQSKKSEVLFPHSVLIKSDREMKHFLKTISAISAMSLEVPQRFAL
jgi:hypothetical protein